jgi:cobalt/nickel transport protein
MPAPWRYLSSLILLLALPLPLQAHFQELIPSTDLITEESGNRIELALTFTHPMQGGPAMEMGEPERFGVVTPQGRVSLKAQLIPNRVDGKRAYSASYKIKHPGSHIFFLEPAPYWEASEAKMIRHYTKVVVDAYGSGEGWDTPVGFPVEIHPLTRPFGLWSGNLFRAEVRQQGKIVPYATVEVEWRNDGSVDIPADAYITQVIRADANGVFAYAMPRGGWWGFAALLDGEESSAGPGGETVPTEHGALIWVHTREMK